MEKFEELYTIFKDGSKIMKFPFDNFKTRFETCCLDLKEQGGYKFLKQQVVDYISYVKTHNKTNPNFQLSMVAFEVFINSRGQKSHYCENWKAKRMALSGQVEEKPESEMNEKELENLRESRRQTKIFNALREYSIKHHIPPDQIPQEERREIVAGIDGSC